MVDDRHCQAIKPDGSRCRAYRIKGLTVCAGHSGLYREAAERGNQRSAEVRRERVEARKLSALDWAAKKLEENGELLAGLIVQAAERGDWRAAAFLYERVHGKPKESVQVEGPSTVGDVQAMSAEELSALRERILNEHPSLRVVGQ